jgi:hypothetical protein
MMEALSSSETSVLTTATMHNIPEDAISHIASFKTDGIHISQKTREKETSWETKTYAGE